MGDTIPSEGADLILNWQILFNPGLVVLKIKFGAE